MKKLLVAILALSTVSAFADGHSMVKLDGCFDGNSCDTLDLDLLSTDQDDKVETRTIAFNYAYNFTGNFGAGITYAQRSNTTDGDIAAAGLDNSTRIGISAYWNFDGAWANSSFVGLHYDMYDVKENDAAGEDDWKDTDITLEYGHRFMIGSVMGVNFNWAPSVRYKMRSRAFGTEVDGTREDFNATHLYLNVANMAATF